MKTKLSLCSAFSRFRNFYHGDSVRSSRGPKSQNGACGTLDP